MATPVIFREYRDGEVIAVFPTLLGNDPHRTCNSYMHVGQHGACNYRLAVMRQTCSAIPEVYADLLAELEQIGYDDLVVYKRWQRRFDDERLRGERAMEKHFNDN